MRLHASWLAQRQMPGYKTRCGRRCHAQADRDRRSGGPPIQRLRTAHAEFDWPSIIGFRNLAVHEYFAVSWSIVWVTATEDVPTLRSHVERILGEAFGSG
jgi:hypothetical protein